MDAPALTKSQKQKQRKKRKRAGAAAASAGGGPAKVPKAASSSSSSSSSSASSFGKGKAKAKAPADPSAQYLSRPTATPVCDAARQYFAQQRVPFKVTCGPTEGWRTVAKLSVRQLAGGPLRIGLFAPGTHDVVDMAACGAHSAALNEAVARVRVALEAERVLGYVTVLLLLLLLLLRPSPVLLLRID